MPHCGFTYFHHPPPNTIVRPTVLNAYALHSHTLHTPRIWIQPRSLHHKTKITSTITTIEGLTLCPHKTQPRVKHLNQLVYPTLEAVQPNCVAMSTVRVRFFFSFPSLPFSSLPFYSHTRIKLLLSKFSLLIKEVLSLASRTRVKHFMYFYYGRYSNTVVSQKEQTKEKWKEQKGTNKRMNKGRKCVVSVLAQQRRKRVATEYVHSTRLAWPSDHHICMRTVAIECDQMHRWSRSGNRCVCTTR